MKSTFLIMELAKRRIGPVGTKSREAHRCLAHTGPMKCTYLLMEMAKRRIGPVGTQHR